MLASTLTQETPSTDPLHPSFSISKYRDEVERWLDSLESHGLKLPPVEAEPADVADPNTKWFVKHDWRPK